MELKELHTIPFAPGVSSLFSTSWSEDDKLCIVTSKGIQILVTVLLLSALAPCSMAADLTGPVFDGANGRLAAFGDFNRDGRTDIAVLHISKRSVDVLLAHDTEPVMRRDPRYSCQQFPVEVVAVAPADFNGDAHLDMAVSTRGSHDETEVYIAWGGPNGLSCPPNDAKKIISLASQPLIVDYDSNTIADLFGTLPNGTSIFVSFHGNHSVPTPTFVPLGNSTSKLRVPHSHAFLDVNHDFAADLVLSANEGYEIWLASRNGYKYNHSISKPPGNTIGQSLFLDVHLEGDLFHLVPVCIDDCYRNSTIYVYSGDHWLNLNPNFKDELGTLWGFYQPRDGEAITVRAGDFNMDGHPDLLATLSSGSGKREVLLLENVPCTANSCGGSSRTFTIRRNALGGLGKDADTGAFFDLYQDGITDVVLSTNDVKLKAFRNTLDYDANFVKVVVLAAAAMTENRGRGGSLAGARVSYRTTTQEGERREAAATQLAQSAYAALQLPHSTFGLGRTPNFVDRLTVTSGGNARDFTQLIPNSQVVVLVASGPMAPWRAQLFVTPSKAALLSVAALSGTCVMIVIIIGILHLRERKEDKRERLQQAHRFHFDAM